MASTAATAAALTVEATKAMEAARAVAIVDEKVEENVHDTGVKD